MTLDEAIKHTEEIAEEKEKDAKYYKVSRCDEKKSISCEQCAEEHRQLAEWLKDYKRLKEQEVCKDAISRQWLMECVNEEWIKFDTEKDKNRFIHLVRDMAPPVNPTKTGHWKRISIDKYSEHAKYWYECDKCGKHNLGNTNFCPNCGCRMVEPQESEEISDRNMKMWEDIFKAERGDKEC